MLAVDTDAGLLEDEYADRPSTCPWRGTKAPLSRDFRTAAGSWHHRDITSAGL
jgi:hypothetical protein